MNDRVTIFPKTVTHWIDSRNGAYKEGANDERFPPRLNSDGPTLEESRVIVRDVLVIVEKLGVDLTMAGLQMELGGMEAPHNTGLLMLLEDVIGIKEEALFEVLGHPLMVGEKMNVRLDMGPSEQGEAVLRELTGRQRRLALRWWANKYGTKEDSSKEIPPFFENRTCLWSAIQQGKFCDFHCIDEQDFQMTFCGSDPEGPPEKTLPPFFMAISKNYSHFKGLLGYLYLEEVRQGRVYDPTRGRNLTMVDVSKDLKIHWNGVLPHDSNQSMLHSEINEPNICMWYDISVAHLNELAETKGAVAALIRRTPGGVKSLIKATSNVIRMIHDLETKKQVKGYMCWATMKMLLDVMSQLAYANIEYLEGLLPVLSSHIIPMLEYNLNMRAPTLDTELLRKENHGPHSLLDVYAGIFDMFLDYANDMSSKNKPVIMDLLTSKMIPLYWGAATNSDDPVLAMVGWSGIRRFYCRKTLPESAMKKLFKDGRKWDTLYKSIVTIAPQDATNTFSQECRQVGALGVVAAIVFQTLKSGLSSSMDNEINGPSKRLVKVGCVDMLMDLVCSKEQPRSVVALAAEILGHFTRLRECRVQMLRIEKDATGPGPVVLALQTSIPEALSAMLLVTSHLLWDPEWFHLLVDSDNVVERVCTQWAARAIGHYTSHPLASCRLWKSELHENIQASENDRLDYMIPAFWFTVLQRCILTSFNYLGTSLKIDNESHRFEEVVARLKNFGIWKLCACNYASESIDVTRGTFGLLGMPATTSVQDIGPELAPLFARWVLYEGFENINFGYQMEKFKDQDRPGFAKTFLSMQVDKMQHMHTFAANAEWRLLLESAYDYSIVVPGDVGFDYFMNGCQEKLHQMGIIGSMNGSKMDKKNWKQYVSENVRRFETNQSSMHKSCAAPDCIKTEKKFGEFQTCSRCKSVCYCSKQCQVKHWKQHKKTCSPSNGSKK